MRSATSSPASAGPSARASARVSSESPWKRMSVRSRYAAPPGEASMEVMSASPVREVPLPTAPRTEVRETDGGASRSGRFGVSLGVTRAGVARGGPGCAGAGATSCGEAASVNRATVPIVQRRRGYALPGPDEDGHHVLLEGREHLRLRDQDERGERG